MQFAIFFKIHITITNQFENNIVSKSFTLTPILTVCTKKNIHTILHVTDAKMIHQSIQNIA